MLTTSGLVLNLYTTSKFIIYKSFLSFWTNEIALVWVKHKVCFFTISAILYLHLSRKLECKSSLVKDNENFSLKKIERMGNDGTLKTFPVSYTETLQILAKQYWANIVFYLPGSWTVLSEYCILSPRFLCSYIVILYSM